MSPQYATSDFAEAKHIFQRLGFVLVKGFTRNEEQISSLNKEARDYVKKASNFNFLKDGNYTYYSGGVPELWGVDNFLPFLSKAGMDNFKKLKLNEFFDSFLSDLFVSRLRLHRIHFSHGNYLHKLAWHHDEPEFNKALVVNFYLEPESGFRLTSRNHILNNGKFSPGRFGNGFFDVIKNYVTIEAERGDLLLFDGKLLHQPYTKSKRLHMHFAFNLSESPTPDRSVDILTNGVCSAKDLFKTRKIRFRNRYILKIVYLLKLVADFIESKI